MRLMMLIMAVLMTVVTVPGQDSDTQTPAEQIAAVKKEYRDANNEWMSTYRKASKEERGEILKNRPRPGKWFPKIWKVIEAHPKDAASVDGLIWMARQGSGDDRTKAMDRLLSAHADSEALGEICSVLERSREPGALDTLRKIMKSTPHATVKGRACYSLAKALKSSSETASKIQAGGDGAARYKRFLDNATYAHLEKVDTSALSTEAIKLLEEVKASCGDVPHPYRKDRTLADAADADLFEMQNLVKGKVAPDIVGEDIDGVAFKLSDYRGKVVMLDFWGHW